MKSVPAPRIKKMPIEPLTQEEVQRMLKACVYSREAQPHNRRSFTMHLRCGHRDQAIILTLLDTGLRALDAHPYKFRHTFAITYLRSGGDIFTLQSLLGHNSLEMVRHYAQIAEIEIAQAHHKASPVDNWRLRISILTTRFSKLGFLLERVKHHCWPDNRASR